MANSPTRTTTSTKSRPTVRQRLGAVMEATVAESALDRVLVKRLRPLRDELRSARRGFEDQALLRAEAEIRAARAEEEATALRIRVAELTAAQERDAAEQPSMSWWRRRRAAEQQPA